MAHRLHISQVKRTHLPTIIRFSGEFYYGTCAVGSHHQLFSRFVLVLLKLKKVINVFNRIQLTSKMASKCSINRKLRRELERESGGSDLVPVLDLPDNPMDASVVDDEFSEIVSNFDLDETLSALEESFSEEQEAVREGLR